MYMMRYLEYVCRGAIPCAWTNAYKAIPFWSYSPYLRYFNWMATNIKSHVFSRAVIFFFRILRNSHLTNLLHRGRNWVIKVPIMSTIMFQIQRALHKYAIEPAHLICFNPLVTIA